MLTIKTNDIAGIVLAGGQGSRMGHVDKGLALHHQRSLVQCVTDLIAPQVGTLIISANRNIQQYQRLGFKVFTDQHRSEQADLDPAMNKTLKTLDTQRIISDTEASSSLGVGYQGPMAGIATCLAYLERNSDCDFALIATCDTPNLPDCLVERLGASLVGRSAQLAVAHDGQRAQNLHCLIKREVWGSLIQHFLAGERAMRAWRQHVSHITVDFSDYTDAFQNLNTLEDLTALSQNNSPEPEQQP